MKRLQEMEIVRMAKNGKMFLTEEGKKAVKQIEDKHLDNQRSKVNV